MVTLLQSPKYISAAKNQQRKKRKRKHNSENEGEILTLAAYFICKFSLFRLVINRYAFFMNILYILDQAH